MKKILLILALVPCFVAASERSWEEAAAIAQQFTVSRPMAHRAPGIAVPPPAYTHFIKQTERPAFYVFNQASSGFVIVSAETNAPDIIGYSDDGRFDADNLPPHIQSWLDRYAQQIEYLATAPEARYTATTTYQPIDPLLNKMEWGQDAPYNKYCPTMEGEKRRSVTGCVATAMAQIMGYYQWPEQAKGTHTLPYDRSTTLDYNKEGKYDWDNILPVNYLRTQTTSKQDSAVAKLMWHVGVACDMQYSCDGSGASSEEMMMRAIQHFDYDSSLQFIYLDYMPTEVFLDSIYQQLRRKQPCYMSARTKDNSSGHAFVCDGIDSKGLVHINWGWDGASNGNFLITLLDPYKQGTGGSASSSAFINEVSVGINIKPNAHGKRTSSMLYADSIYYSGSAYTVKRNAEFIINFDDIIVNGLWPFSGTYGLGIYQNNEFVQWLAEKEGMIYYYSFDRMNVVFPSSLPAGEYDLYPIWQADGEATINRIQTGNRFMFHLTVTNEEILINGGADLSIKNMKTQVDSCVLNLSWSSLAFYFRVIISSGSKIFVDAIQSQRTFTYTADSVGVYQYSILPLTRTKTETAWTSAFGEALLTKTYFITQLQYQPNNLSAVITWKCNAPKYQFLLERDGKKLGSGTTANTSFTLNGSKAASYQFSVTPLDGSGKMELGQTQTLSFSLPAESALESVSGKKSNAQKIWTENGLIIHINNKTYTILGNAQH